MRTVLPKPISFAIISDLHIGKARAADLYPAGTDLDANVIDNDYIDKFQAFVRSENIRPDYLIIPGDVSNTADPAQIALGSDVILKCAAALGVPEERVIFVPGNHDVDWNILKLADPTGHYSNLRFSAFRDARLIYDRCASRATHNVFEYPYYGIWTFKDLLVVGYNTSWEDHPSAKINHGSIKQEHLDHLAKELKALTFDPLQVRAFVLHHHPIQYPDPTNWKDFSELQNAPGLFSLLWDHHFDFVVHGHRHHPFITRQSHGFGRHIPILCAGSFSALLYPGWSNQIGNQFHVVEISGRTSERGSAEGNVQSWAYLTGKGWCQSRGDRTGIAHIEGFGAYFETGHLVDVLRAQLRLTFSTQDYARWSTITEADPPLARVPRKQVTLALDQLTGELDFEILLTDTEDFILLRKKP